jgi:hypothetical protein
MVNIQTYIHHYIVYTFVFTAAVHCKKGKPFSWPQPGCHKPNCPWLGKIKSFPSRKSLVHPSWGRKYSQPFFTVYIYPNTVYVHKHCTVKDIIQIHCTPLACAWLVAEGNLSEGGPQSKEV